MATLARMCLSVLCVTVGHDTMNKDVYISVLCVIAGHDTTSKDVYISVLCAVCYSGA